MGSSVSTRVLGHKVGFGREGGTPTPYFVALYRGKYPLITIQFTSKTCFFVFPDTNMGASMVRLQCPH